MLNLKFPHNFIARVLIRTWKGLRGRIPNFFSDLTWTWLETVLVKFKLSQVLGWSSKL